MTKKVLTYSFAAVALLSGCADDFQSYETAQIEGGKGRLVEAGLLGASVETEPTSETRAYTSKGRFVWMPEKVGDDGYSVIAGTNQRIGLCWTGVNTQNPDFGAIETPGENVYTNYLFEHVGWMEEGASKVSIDQCDGSLQNGAYWIDENGNSAVAGGIKANVEGTLTGSRYNKYYYGDGWLDNAWRVRGQYTANGSKKHLNLGAGVFKTENTSVFEGQYIVYFPYTDQFTKGAIVAHEPRQFTVNCSHDKYETYSKYAFCAGYQSHYAGGTAQDAFSAGIYTGSVTIALKNSNDDSWRSHNIKRVILYSQTKGIIYEAGISAASIIKARQAGDMGLVEQVGEAKSTNTVYADLVSDAGNYYTASIANKWDNAWDLITIPVLPQTTDLSVILVDTDEKTLKYEPETKEYEIKAGGNLRYIVDVKDGFQKNYYAVDEPSFVDALKVVNADNDESYPEWWRMHNITLLSDINLKEVYDSEYNGTLPSNTIEAQRNLTIQADASAPNARLIVNGETTRTIQTRSDVSFYINVPVVVEGFGCCYSTPGTLNIYPNVLQNGNDPASSRLTFNNEVINYGETNILFDGADEVINFNGKVINGWDDEYVRANSNYTDGTWARKKAGGKLTVKNTYDGKVRLYLNEGIENDAQVIFEKAEELTSGDALGKRSLRVTTKNIVNAGVVMNGVSNPTNESQVPGGLFQINDNVLVTVNEGITNTNEFGRIHVNGTGESDTNDGRLDILASGASTNKGTIDNDGVINFLGSGNLDNSNGLFLDNLTGQVGGMWVNNGATRTPGSYSTKYKQGIRSGANTYQTDLNNGIYATKTNSNERLGHLLNDPTSSRSCNVIDIVGADEIDGSYVYDLTREEDYQGKDLANYDVRINAAGKNINFIYPERDKKVANKYVNTKSMGHCMFVYTQATLDKCNEFIIENNLYVRAGGNLTEGDHLAFFHVANTINVANRGTLTVKETVETSDAYATGSRGIQAKNITSTGNITTNETFVVDNDFTVQLADAPNGTLNSNGNNNVVGNDFKLYGRATFAAKTTTTINGTFYSIGANSLLTRLGINGGSSYRATVNCKALGATEGNAVGGWPTVFGE